MVYPLVFFFTLQPTVRPFVYYHRPLYDAGVLSCHSVKVMQKKGKKQQQTAHQTLHENKTTEIRIKRHAMFQLRQTQNVCLQLNGWFCIRLNEQALQHWHTSTDWDYIQTQGVLWMPKERSNLSCTKRHSRLPHSIIQQNGPNVFDTFFELISKKNVSFSSLLWWKSINFDLWFSQNVVAKLLRSTEFHCISKCTHNDGTISVIRIWSNDYYLLTICLLTQ